MLTLNNKSNYIRKELSALLLRYFFNDDLEKRIEGIPVDLNPRDNDTNRCCVYKDRAMTRYSIMALLGLSIEKDDDEYKSLKVFLDEVLNREKVEAPVITVLDTACSSCTKSSYRVTEGCRGCVARPCQTNCPADAIKMIKGKSYIDVDLCKNCGKCKDVCPYNAIIYIPVPCEESCPVGAVNRDENGRMSIDYDKCIFCGKCSRSCPFGAVMERSQIIDVAREIKKGTEVVALVAPSIIGQFPGSINQLADALKKIGFSGVVEVAAGADITARKEAEEFTHKMKNGEKLMGTSCCPAYVEAVEKHVPAFKTFVSDTKTPMFYSAEISEKAFSGAKKVFIGPCIAKKHEALRDGSVDYVLTFEELGTFFMALDIELEECSEGEIIRKGASFHARAFPSTKGVADAVGYYLKGAAKENFDPVVVDGLSKKNINLLKLAAGGKLKGNMFEVMSCEGGCICGPGVVSNPKITARKLSDYIKNEKIRA